MKAANWKPRDSRIGGLGPMLGLLLLAVLLPTAGVLWFMGQAMRNERLVVRQKLEDTYSRQLAGVREQVDAFWRQRLASLAGTDATTPPQQVFAKHVTMEQPDRERADCVVLYGPDSRLLYPEMAASTADTATSGQRPPAWGWAERLEYIEKNPLAAAAAYAEATEQAADIHISAQALHAQARCLVKAEQRDAGLNILIGRLAGDPRYHDARDPRGRLLVPSAQLYALELIADTHDDRFAPLADALRRRVLDYGGTAMPSAQRLFLMRSLESLPGQAPCGWPVEAEELALRYVEQQSGLPPTGQLSRSPLEGIWQFAMPDRRLVALYKEQNLLDVLNPLIAVHSTTAGAAVTFAPAGQESTDPAVFMRLPAGESMPDWQLTVRLQGGNPFAAAADRQITLLIWTAILIIAGLAILVLIIARYLTRQARLTRLKNDLIATVSHELKTPLASVRVLVDTLIENRCGDANQTREYLEMIARENLRLSRLIDNFLTFSRMERNKRAFACIEVNPAQVVADAVEAVRERYEAGGFTLNVEVAPDLPTVIGDPDALVTVLVNLLDNAYKYSRERKQVTVKATTDDGTLVLSVQDQGIGLARRELKRVFSRFYQVDQRLSRETGGCGLGLSIVRFIVDAHDGRVDVHSQPGKGSAFSVRLPIRAS